MQTILIINSKGGSGKTTVATNLAGYYASENHKTALMDYDPQGSSIHWLKLRPNTAVKIHGANAAKQAGTMIRCWQRNIPDDIEKLVIDAPAGIDRLLLQDMVRRADCIVVPVGPSSIDVHASADFIRDLLLVGQVRVHQTKVGVIANRARINTPIYKPLERFVNTLNMRFITRLSDSDNYILAAEQGIGVFELNSSDTAMEREEFKALINWLEHPDQQTSKPAPIKPKQTERHEQKGFWSFKQDKKKQRFHLVS